jgi:tetratricopeptide (TPR) repeat protein
MSTDLQQLRILRIRHEYAEAGTLADRLLAERPEDSQADVAVARLLLEQDRPQQALDLIDRAIARTPGNPAPAAWRIAALERLLRFDEARAYAKSAVDRFPESAEVMLSNGRLHLESLCTSDALRFFTRSIELNPSWPRGWEWSCTALRELNRSDEAIDLVNQAVGDGVICADLLLEACFAYMNKGDYRIAMLWARKAADLEPERPYVPARIAELLRFLGEHNEAQRTLEAASERWPTSADPLDALGDLFAAQGEHHKALSAYRGALERDDTHQEAHLGVIYGLRNLERLGDAEIAACAAIERHPHWPRLDVAAGWVLLAQDRDQAALDVFAAAERKNPYLWASQYGSLQGLRSLNRVEEALAKARGLRDNTPLGSQGWCRITNAIASTHEMVDSDDLALECYEDV